MFGTKEGLTESLYIVGETMKPMLTNDMGSGIEIFDTSGPTGGGPPTHRHPWEEIYVVTKGKLQVTVAGESRVLGAGEFAHVPANTPHSYLTIEDAEFLTIVTRGNASKFFRRIAKEVRMQPLDVPHLVRAGAEHGIEFLPPGA